MEDNGLMLNQKKSAEKIITDSKKTPEELINYIIKKNSIIEGKDTVALATADLLAMGKT